MIRYCLHRETKTFHSTFIDFDKFTHKLYTKVHDFSVYKTTYSYIILLGEATKILIATIKW